MQGNIHRDWGGRTQSSPAFAGKDDTPRCYSPLEHGSHNTTEFRLFGTNNRTRGEGKARKKFSIETWITRVLPLDRGGELLTEGPNSPGLKRVVSCCNGVPMDDGMQSPATTPLNNLNQINFPCSFQRNSYYSCTVMDASTSLAPGMLQRDVMTLGSYDQCLAVEQSAQFQGRLCVVVTKDLLPEIRPLSEENSQVSTYVFYHHSS